MNILRKTILARFDSILLYHGTDAYNVESILRQGLKPRGSVGNLGWDKNTLVDVRNNSVFLTADIEKAARYSFGEEKDQVPAILEIRISGRHAQKLKYDPLDRNDAAWEIDDEGGTDFEALVILEDIASDAIRNITGHKPHFSVRGLPQFHEVEDLDGVNVYKVLPQAILKVLDSNWITRKDVVRAIQDALKKWGRANKRTPGQYQSISIHPYLDVRRDGTIKMSKDWMETREQLFYQKGLPPSTIKGVWFREIDFRSSGINQMKVDEKSFGVRRLPYEVVEDHQTSIEITNKIIRKEYYTVDMLYRNSEDFLVVSDHLENMGLERWEEVDHLQTLTREEIEEDFESLIDTLAESAIYIQDDLHNSHGNDPAIHEDLWILVNPRDAMELVS